MFSAPTSFCIIFRILTPICTRNLEIRARGRPVAEHEFARVDLRKQFGAQYESEQRQHQAAARPNMPTAIHAAAIGRARPRRVWN